MLTINGTCDFDDGRDADAVVGRARAGRDGIVVRADDQRVCAHVAGKPGQNIGDWRAGRVGVAREGLLQGGLISEVAELSEDAIADEVMRARADRMRLISSEDRSECRDAARR